ncbi:MAG: CoA transferase, partial [Novosphingobium sp.]
MLADQTCSDAISALDGTTLLGERAARGRFSIPARRSAGGKCHLLAAQDGWIALNLARDGDRELLPALFGARMADVSDLGEIAELVYSSKTQALVERGREMGLAIASVDEPRSGEATTQMMASTPAPPPTRSPL